MRVKIQHSVDITDVEEKIINLIVESMKSIDDVNADSNDLLTLLGMGVSHQKYKLSSELIHRMREKLALYDSVLSDAGMIIEGLFNYHESENNPPAEQESTAEPSPEKVQEVVDNISERFANIKKEFNNADKG